MGNLNGIDANKMANAIENKIMQVAQQVLKNSPNDREVEGRVISKNQYNQYTIVINNYVYKNILQERSLGPISNGTIVKVKVPNNQMSNAYICGVVDGSIQTLGGGGTGGTTNYQDLENKPVSNTTHTTSQTPLSNEVIDGTINFHKISKTGALADTIQDSTHRTVTDTEKTNWNSKVDKTTTINGKPLSVNIELNASDVNALPDTTKYAASLSLLIDNTTYVVTAQLKDQNGNNLGAAQTIDLPLESVVVSGSYDNINKKVVLTLKDGSTVEFSVADLVSGLQETLVSGINIKTINGESILGSGDIEIKGGSSTPLYNTTGQNTDGAMTQKSITDELNKKANKETAETLWTNPDISQPLSTQTINISKDLKQYKIFQLQLHRATDNTTGYVITQAKPYDSSWLNSNFVGLFGYLAYQRYIDIRVPNNQIVVGDCYKQTSLGGGVVDNSKIILVSVVGIK